MKAWLLATLSRTVAAIIAVAVGFPVALWIMTWLGGDPR